MSDDGDDGDPRYRNLPIDNDEPDYAGDAVDIILILALAAMIFILVFGTSGG